MSMKKIKRGIMAFLAGEFLTLWYKDDKFKKKVEKETSFVDKIKIIFHEMVDFNKDLVDNAKQVDINKHTNQAKAFVEKELNQIKGKIDKLETQRKDLSSNKIKPLIADLEVEYQQAILKGQRMTQELRDQFQVDEKIDEIKKLIEKVKRKKLP